MRDPIVLCSICLCKAIHMRYRPGLRCSNSLCPQYMKVVVTELDIKSLRRLLGITSSTWSDIRDWVRSQNE